MKIVLAYLIPIDQWQTYGAGAKRFSQTYRQFPAGIEHELLVVCCNGPVTEAIRELFSDLPARFIEYRGGGWDCGAAQEAARIVDCDFLVCANSLVYFDRPGWLRRFAEARMEHGEGLYGASASYESMPYVPGEISPHIRTAFYGCNPVTFRQFPFTVENREQAFAFENGQNGFTRWFEKRGEPCLMVTWDGCYGQQDYRKPVNVFRKGDQSNLIVRDRHMDMYDAASPSEQAELKSRADGGLPSAVSCIHSGLEAGNQHLRGGFHPPVNLSESNASSTQEPVCVPPVPSTLSRRPLVSIGMPIYNAERYLAGALDALLAQDYGNFEIVISDNCSQDGTEQICKSYAEKDSRIRYIQQRRNQGMPWNFAEVVRESRGEYFMWASHDDLFHPSYIRKCMETLLTHPTAVFCCTEINFIDAEGQPHSDWSKKGYKNIDTLGMTVVQRLHELLRRAGWFATYGLMKLEDTKKLSLGLNVYGFDVVLIEELLLFGDFVKVPEALFTYRIAKTKSAQDYQNDFNPEDNPVAATRTPYTDLAMSLLEAVYRSQLSDTQKTASFACFITTLSTSNSWWREQITAEVLGEGARLDDDGFALLLAMVLSRSIPLDTMKQNSLMQAAAEVASSGGSLLQAAEQLVQQSIAASETSKNACVEAKRLFSVGDFEGASRLFGMSLEQQESSDVWQNWATARLAGNHLVDAERGFRRALQLDPQNHLAALKLGILLSSAQYYADAIPYLEQGAACIEDRQQKVEITQLVGACRSMTANSAESITTR